MIDNNESGFNKMRSRLDNLPPITGVKQEDERKDGLINTSRIKNSYELSFSSVKPKEIKIFDITISDNNKRLLIRGKYCSQSFLFHKNPICTVAVGSKKIEVLIFPKLNIFEQSDSTLPIEPFEEGQFCHYITDDEAALIRQSETYPIDLTSFESIKFRHRP